MPIEHMGVRDADPFAKPSQLAAEDQLITAGRYRLPDLSIEPGAGLITGAGPRKGGWQRVTTMVKAIGDARALDLWHQRLMLVGLAHRPDLYDLVCATVGSTPDETDLKNALDDLAPKILAAAGADEGANLGTSFHGFTEVADLGLMQFARRIWHGRLRNYSEGMEHQGLEIIPEYIERLVVIERFGLAGTFDRLVLDRVTGDLRVSDLKTQKRFWTWLEIAAQLAAYAMADAMWDKAKRCYVEMPRVAQDQAIVAWIPRNHPDREDGVDFFSVDLERGRAALDLCSQVDKMRSEAKSVKQTWGLLRPAPHLAAVEAFAARLDSVASPAEGSAVWSEIVKAGLGDSAELREIAAGVNRRLIEADLRG